MLKPCENCDGLGTVRDVVEASTTSHYRSRFVLCPVCMGHGLDGKSVVAELERLTRVIRDEP